MDGGGRMCQSGPGEGEGKGRIDRRIALKVLGGTLGMASFVGCSSRSITRRLPEPDWPSSTTPDLDLTPTPSVPGGKPATFPNVQVRGAWAGAGPNYANMNRMTPPRWITVHHDGMSVFQDKASESARDRLELIRTAHRNKGWGDIGYHYAIDPAGRIHACRPVTWQGAHVKDWNEGNIAIVVLGNFDIQRPTRTQLWALKTHLANVRSFYKIPRKRVRGHKDWPGAKTACPGRYLHPQLRSV